MPRRVPEVKARVAELWNAGLSDAEIGAALGRPLSTVRFHRRSLGLRTTHARRAGLLAAAMARQLAAAGAASLRAAGPNRYRAAAADLAGRYGLPADLHPDQVAVVAVLSGGPRDTAALAAAVRPGVKGRGSRAFACRQAAGGNLLADLSRRGLVARVRRAAGIGAGSRPALYMLTPAALDLLAAAGNGGAHAGD